MCFDSDLSKKPFIRENTRIIKQMKVLLEIIKQDGKTTRLIFQNAGRRGKKTQNNQRKKNLLK